VNWEKKNFNESSLDLAEEILHTTWGFMQVGLDGVTISNLKIPALVPADKHRQAFY
jgi:hypothetical protein